MIARCQQGNTAKTRNPRALLPKKQAHGSLCRVTGRDRLRIEQEEFLTTKDAKNTKGRGCGIQVRRRPSFRNHCLPSAPDAFFRVFRVFRGSHSSLRICPARRTRRPEEELCTASPLSYGSGPSAPSARIRNSCPCNPRSRHRPPITTLSTESTIRFTSASFQGLSVVPAGARQGPTSMSYLIRIAARMNDHIDCDERTSSRAG